MGRLKLKGRPVMNCNELYELADIRELLRQHRAFKSFAISSLRFGEKEKIFVGILKKTEDAGGEYRSKLPPIFPADYQEEIAEFQEGFAGELPKDAETFGFVYSVICIAYLAHIPLQEVMQEDVQVLWSCWRGEKAQEDQIKDIVLSQEETVLTAGRVEYRLAWWPEYALEKGQTITTHRIRVAGAGAGNCAAIHLRRKDGEEEILKLERGALCLVNAVDGVAVAVLDNVQRAGEHTMARDGEGNISIDGKKIPYSNTVTSFALSGRTGEYICVESNGRLTGTYVSGHNSEQAFSFVRDLVEARFVGDVWYLLTKTGIVYCKNGQNKSGVASLAVVGKETK